MAVKSLEGAIVMVTREESARLRQLLWERVRGAEQVEQADAQLLEVFAVLTLGEKRLREREGG